ncbi:MAG: tRNA lysidine(34) synthetase TilS [Acidobacteriota bacterium]
MSPCETIERFFRDHAIDPEHVLVAVSGGTDSTALLLALEELAAGRFRLSAAHVNHHLRGVDSDEDERFVRDLCQERNIPLQVESSPLDPDLEKSLGVEGAARTARYRVLGNVQREVGARYVATAHQKNDQAETVLMRIISGSGVDRLSGIQPLTPEGIIRPFLRLKREDLEQYLEEKGTTPRDDRSNDDERFLRNRVRAQLMPLLAQWNPAIIDTLTETATQAREQSSAFRPLIAESSSRWIEEHPDTAELDLDKIPSDPWFVQCALARQIHRLDPESREVSAADLRRIARNLSTASRVSVTRHLELVRMGGWLVLRRKQSPLAATAFEFRIHPGAEIELPLLRARVWLRSPLPSDSAITGATHGARCQRFQIPRENEATGFVLRNRRAGDRFRPLGMMEQKKLTDFMIDRKIPAKERDRIPLLTWNGQVIWVPGIEVSEDFKVRNGDQNVFEIRIVFDDERPTDNPADFQRR